MKSFLLLILFGAIQAQAFTPESNPIMLDETPEVIKAVEAEENPAKVFSGLVKATRELMKPIPVPVTEATTAKAEL